MNESDSFWEIIAAVVPVLALAFVLEIRYMRFHRLGPFDRLHAALTHALTILILLASEAAALIHLQGLRQARWAENVALYGCLTALSVILITPTGRLLIIASHGTTRAGYVAYWKARRRLRVLRRDIKDLGRQHRKGKRLLTRLDEMISTAKRKDLLLPARDLQTIWQKETLRSAVASLQVERADFVQSQAAFLERTKKAERSVRKLERKLVKHSGTRTKIIMKALDKHTA